MQTREKIVICYIYELWHGYYILLLSVLFI